jgi:hypothetical protein
LCLTLHLLLFTVYKLPDLFCRDAQFEAVRLNHSLFSNPKILREGITALLDFRRTARARVNSGDAVPIGERDLQARGVAAELLKTGIADRMDSRVP